MGDTYDEDELPTLRPPPPSGIAPRGGSGFRPAARAPSLEELIDAELFDDVTPVMGAREPDTIPGVPLGLMQSGRRR